MAESITHDTDIIMEIFGALSNDVSTAMNMFLLKNNAC